MRASLLICCPNPISDISRISKYVLQDLISSYGHISGPLRQNSSQCKEYYALDYSFSGVHTSRRKQQNFTNRQHLAASGLCPKASSWEGRSRIQSNQPSTMASYDEHSAAVLAVIHLQLTLPAGSPCGKLLASTPRSLGHGSTASQRETGMPSTD